MQATKSRDMGLPRQLNTTAISCPQKQHLAHRQRARIQKDTCQPVAGCQHHTRKIQGTKRLPPLGRSS
jgi:hypothetical protein